MKAVQKIREARSHELAAIVALTLAAYHEYSETMPGGVFRDYMENIRRTLEEDHRATLLVAMDGDEIVASTMLYPAGLKIYTYLPEGSAYPELRLLAVSPQARGRGFGRALVKECISRVRDGGESAITLHTSGVMLAAMKLYIGMGFERYPEIDFYPEPDLCVQGYILRFTAE
ncbi:MAG: hypothetical protein NVS9B15_09730 [Acidobacteriaceae bacterium]